MMNNKVSASPSSCQPSLTKTPYILPNIIFILYNFCSYFLLVPFIIKFDSVSGRYMVQKRGKFVQCLVVLQQLITIMTAAFFVSLDPAFYTTHDDFTKKFRVATMISWFLCMLNVCRSFWTNQKNLTRVFNQLASICTSLEKLGNKSPHIFAVLACTLALVLYLVSWGILETVNATHKRHNFLEQNFGHYATLYNFVLTPIVWVSLTSLHLADLLILLFSLWLYLPVHYFVEWLESPQNCPKKVSGQQRELVIKTFEQLCKYSEMLNTMNESIITGACFGLVPYYSFKLLSIFQENVLEALQFLAYSLVFIVTFGLAAEANMQAGHLVSWLQRHESHLTFLDLDDQLSFQRKLTIAVEQVRRNQYGLKGTCFIVSYSFLGNIAGLILTYAMIIFQLQSIK